MRQVQVMSDTRGSIMHMYYEDELFFS